MAEYNLVADAVRAAQGVEVEFENLGGVRAPILAGPITMGDLAQVDPFQDTIVIFSMRGSEIRRLLERHSPAVSGLRYRTFAGKLQEATIGGAPLDDARLYTCATNSYYAGELSGFEIAGRKDTGKLRNDAVLDFIRRAGTISPAYDGRRVVVDTY
jgi:2',3'-cyclic-nucleotide 2'-phosphodiesterase (5'-nucleotidase family)